MTRRWLMLGLLCLLVFSFTFVLRTPAVWLIHLTKDRIPVAAGWQSVSGTAFNTRFYNLTLVLDDGRRIDLNRLDLTISPFSLLLARVDLSYQIQAYGGELRGRIRFKHNSWEIPAIQGDIMLSALTQFLPQFEVPGMSGRIAIDGKDLSAAYEQLPATGQLDVEIKQLQLDIIQDQSSLGTYAMSLAFYPQNKIEGELITTDNKAPLNIDGRIGFDPLQNRLDFIGTARASSSAFDETMSDVLALMGKAGADETDINWQFYF